MFGEYEIQGVIGRGGMGIVYQARQTSLNRNVALKMVRFHHNATPTDLARFQQEAEASARLDHPNIVPVFEFGEVRGLCYFTMKLVEQARSLATVLQNGAMEPRQGATLVAKIARAVHYAHQRGVIHRDIKPGNILLDEAGEPNLADFGLAKLLEADMKLTMSDRVIGTPQYMSPEQASATGSEVTTAMDIYSIGAVLYEIITGRPPFRADSIHEMLRQVAEREPVPPRHIVPEIDRDLQTICLKCLEKNPRKRYASANALADDLENWLQFMPISARPATKAGRVAKWARRRPGVAALTSGLTVMGIIALTSLIYAWRQAEKTSKQNANLLRQSLDGFTSNSAALRSKDRPGHRWEALDAVAKALDIARQLHTPASLNEALPSLQNEAIACLSLADMREAERWPVTDMDKMDSGEISPDFSMLAHAYQDGSVSIISLPDRKELAAFPGTGAPVLDAPRFSRDGRRLAAVRGKRGTDSATLTVWEVHSSKAVMQVETALPATCDFTPDGRSILVGFGTQMHQIEVPSGNILQKFKLESAPHTIRCSPDGRLVAVSHLQGGVEIHDLNQQKNAAVLAACGATRCIAWHHSRPVLAIPSENGSVYLWNVTQAETEATSWPAHSGIVRNVVWHPNGRHLFSEGADGFVTMWDSRTKKIEISLPARSLDQLHVSPDGRRLGPLRLGDQEQLLEVSDGAVVRHGEGHPGSLINSASWSTDGRVLATAGEDTLKFWNRDAEQIGSINSKENRSVLWTKDSLILSSKSGLMRWPILKTNDQTPTRMRLAPAQKIDPRSGWEWASISRDERWLAAALPPNVMLFDLSLKDAPRAFAAQPKAAFVSISPAGNWLAAGTWQGQGVRVWSLPEGRVTDLTVAGSANVGFNLDGKLLVTGNGQEYAFWTIGTWKQAHTVRTSLGDFYGAMAFSPRGTAIAIESERNRALIIHAPTLREMTSPDFDRQRPLNFSPPYGDLLVNADARQHLVIWDVALLRQELKAIGLDWPLPELPKDQLPLMEGVDLDE
jgi:serine/threonine protein kinase/WD40 repeat protein|uniref:protein kinase domain-containing protein n=1 Tax=Prosthecobacter sp. TaxID=1965333 RepID=UPI0037835601